MLVKPDPSLRVGRTRAAISTPTHDRPPAAQRAARRDRARRARPGPPRAHAGAGRRRACARGRRGRLDYTFDLGPRVRAIVLDTVQRAKGAHGVVTPREVAFLRDELRRAGDRWVLVFTHQPLGGFAEGAPLQALLDADPRVLAAIAGDTHHNRITPRPTAAGGYWQITTSALADFPQQARMLRVRETAGGGAVLETWMLDTAPDPLADTARALAFLDAQGGRPDHDAGTRLDRNVRLYRAAPRR